LLRFLIVVLCAGLAASCGKPPVNGGNTDNQLGNPNAHPERDAEATKSNKQPADNKAGRDPHTGLKTNPQ
jgi:hypothetical protein